MGEGEAMEGEGEKRGRGGRGTEAKAERPMAKRKLQALLETKSGRGERMLVMCVWTRGGR